MTKGPLIRIVATLRTEVWAIQAGALEEMIRRAERMPVEFNALLPGDPARKRNALSRQMERDSWSAARPYVRDGVAVIPILGPIMAYASWLNDLCGVTSYDVIADAFNTAVADASVKAVLFAIDTPGGMVTDCPELAEMIRNARGTKPIIAHVSGLCCSAGYWLASACDEIVVASTAVTGCLGVAMSVTDTSALEKAAGIKTIEIVSTQTPYKRPDVTTDDGRAQVLRMIDATAEVFLDDVALNRGVDRKVVDAKFGKGDVFVGKAAIEAGLADACHSFEHVIGELSRLQQAA